jgi:hypothetical protein
VNNIRTLKSDKEKLMEIIIYVVGDSIVTAKYSSWFSKKFLPVTEIPALKTNFDNVTLINSIIKSRKTPQFFLNEEEASEYAISRAKAHEFDDRFITCPIVFEVKMELNTENEFYCTTLLTAKIHGSKVQHQFQELNHNLDFNNSSDTSFQSFGPRVLTCKPSNYHGDFNRLFTPAANFTFLCGNSRGFTPTNQNNKFKLPKVVTKSICEYVAGHTLGK